MAGTAAAYTLRKHTYAVTIIEKADRLGGRMRSEAVGGIISEAGASFVGNIYPNVLGFLQEVGLAGELAERKSIATIMRSSMPYQLNHWSTWLGNSWLSYGAKYPIGNPLVLLV